MFPEDALNLFESQEKKARVCECRVHPKLKKLEHGGMHFVGSRRTHRAIAGPQAWWVCLATGRHDVVAKICAL